MIHRSLSHQFGGDNLALVAKAVVCNLVLLSLSTLSIVTPVCRTLVRLESCTSFVLIPRNAILDLSYRLVVGVLPS